MKNFCEITRALAAKKKYLLLIPLFLFSLMANAADQYPDPKVSNSLSVAVAAVGDGETIWLDDTAPYDNVKDRDGEGHGDDYTKIRDGKNITIRAIEGKHPVIKYEVPFQVRKAGKAKFIGVKFDGTNLTQYDNYFHFYDNDDNSLEFENCEFTNIAKWILSVNSSCKAASIKITDCNFNNNSSRGILSQGTLTTLQIENSEFSSWSGSDPIIDNYGSSSLNSLQIDGCDFHDNATHLINNSSSATISSCTIKNSTFQSNTKRAIYNQGTLTTLRIENSGLSSFTGGSSYPIIDNYGSASLETLQIDNCTIQNNSAIIIGNASSSTNTGEISSCSISNSTFKNNSKRGILNYGTITSLQISGCELSYFTAETVIDNYNTASIGTLQIDECEIHHNSNYIIRNLNGSSTYSTITTCEISDSEFHNNAKRVLYAAGNINSIDIDGCDFSNNSEEVIYSSDAVHVGSCSIDNCYFHDLTQRAIYINETTTSALSVTNSTFANISPGSASVIESKTADGTALVDHCSFYNCVVASSSYGAVKFPTSPNASVQNSIFMMADGYSGNGRAIHMPDNNEAKNCLTFNYVYDSNSGIRYGVTQTDCLPNTDPVFADAEDGDFTLEYNWTTGRFTPARGAATDGTDLGDPRWHSTVVIPNASFPTDYVCEGVAAQLENRISHNGANLAWNNNADDSQNGVAYWKLHSNKGGSLKVTLNMAETSTSGHRFKVEIFDADDSAVGDPLEEPADSWSHANIELPGTILLPSKGDYKIKLTNTNSGHWSTAILTSITLSYIGGDVINVPAYPLIGEDAILVAPANKLQRNGDRNLESNNPEAGTTDYAWWKVRATQSSTLNVKINVLTGTSVGHRYIVGLYSDLEDEPIAEVAEAESGSWKTGEYSLGTFSVKKDNDYYVKVNNSLGWSTAILGSIRLSFDIPTIDENEEDVNTVIGAYAGKTGDVQITRKLVGGMCNTICLPFNVPASEVTRVFGEGTVLGLTSAEVDDYILNLNFENVDEMEAGKPYLVRPAGDIEDPKFFGVTLVAEPVNVNGGDASFVGNFVVSSIAESPNNLFLGQNDMLYFPTTSVEIKGMRAYFAIDESAPAPTRARIVTKEEEVTAIDLIQNDQPALPSNTVQKVIIDGQLILIKNGVQYSIMGMRVK